MDLHDDIRGKSPIQFLTPSPRLIGLNLSAVTKSSFAGVIARYVFLVTHSSPRQADTWFPSLPLKKCTGVRYVITKFSRMDSLPNFLTHGTPLRARERAPLKSTCWIDYVSRIDLNLLPFYLETLPMRWTTLENYSSSFDKVARIHRKRCKCVTNHWETLQCTLNHSNVLNDTYS